MNKKTIAQGTLLVLVVALTACGSGTVNQTEDTTIRSGAVTLNEDYPNALPVSSQLAIGTLLLEGTDNAVTERQAQELLLPWQMIAALQESGTAAQAETAAVLDQILAAMTLAQMTAIDEMQLTPDSMTELAEAQGFGGGSGEAGGFGPPKGARPGGAAGEGSRSDLEQTEAAVAERMGAVMGTVMTQRLVAALEARADGQTDVVTSNPKSDPQFDTMRALLAATAEATGMTQQEIMAQAQQDSTVAEIVAAHGASVNDVLAQAVAAETERISQAAVRGTLSEAEADSMLSSLEPQVRAILEQPLQIGGGQKAGRK